MVGRGRGARGPRLRWATQPRLPGGPDATWSSFAAGGADHPGGPGGGFVPAREKPRKTGQVTGRVTFKGKPLPGGRVVFHFEDAKKTVAVRLGKEGTYSAPSCRRGRPGMAWRWKANLRWRAGCRRPPAGCP